MDTKEWRRTIDGQTYFISTSRDLLPHEFIQKAFDNPDMYWAKPTSAANMKTMLDNSCTLGLYKVEPDSSSPKYAPIGIARMVTDYMTFAYLTDVYILEEYRKFGLGVWLINCCKETVEQMPNLRWMLLLTGSEPAERMYKRELGMEVLGRSGSGLVAMGGKRTHLQAAGAGREKAPAA